MRRLFFFLKEVLFKNTSLRLAFGLSAFLFVEAWIYPAWGQMPVLINGRLLVAQRPASARVILASAGYNPGRGHLLDVDGRPIKSGGGSEAGIKVNGRGADFATLVGRDDSIEFIPGRDRVEGIRTGVEQVVIATRVNGVGEYTVVQALGRPGRKLVSRGAVSGKIVSARTLSEAQPMLVTRTDTRPNKIVALTFDDGPNPPFTGRIVKILRDAQASATFFVLGKQVAAHPGAVRRALAAGAQIANHSFSHHRLDNAPEAVLAQELDNTRNLIFPITNYEPKWFRPPYGATSPLLETVAQQKGYRVIRWNVDTRDWAAANPDEISNLVIQAAFPGAVVLMHDGGGNRTNTVLALPKIIQSLRERGYTFVTLDQLVK